MKTGSSVDRLTTAGKGLYDAALALSSTTGVVEEPVVLIETALRHVTDVLANSERLDQPMSMQTRFDVALLLLGLDGCLSCREDIVEFLLDHSVCTEAMLTQCPPGR